ncbi:3-methylornithine--L-lysine ligase PylC [Anaerovoracaceae bacterium 41-7]
MKVAIIGGKLQGTEAVYLASACGFESILIDSNPNVPAAGLADRFICGDITASDEAVIAAMMEADFVLPANENDRVLEAVCRICEEKGLPLAFDKAAYEITKSKKKSDRLFLENGIPAPRYYPKGKAPYIMKPSGESGSAGVTYARSKEEVETFLAKCTNPENWIVQEYLEGPSYSIEVIGIPGNYRTYAVTQIHMDQFYDCCKVTCPCPITKEQEAKFSILGKKLAQLVKLHGIMDVEVIDDGEDFKVLEIDARIPSQTPIAVLYASGINELSELADIIVKGEFMTPQCDLGRFSVYEHYRREKDAVVQEGEHMMSDAGPLEKRIDFCGSKVSLLDEKENGDFCGIFVNWADSKEKLEAQREQILRNLKTLP